MRQKCQSRLMSEERSMKDRFAYDAAVREITATVLTGLDLQYEGLIPESPSSTLQVIAQHIHDKEDRQLEIFILAPSGSTAGPHRTHLERPRTSVGCDQACSGQEGVASLNHCLSLLGWPCLIAISR